MSTKKTTTKANKVSEVKPTTTTKVKQPTKVVNQLFELPNVSTLVEGKEVSIKVSQIDGEGNNNTYTQKFSIVKEDFNTMLGTALNRLFEYQTALNSVNDKGKFKATLPLIVAIESNHNGKREYLTTESLSPISQANLKLGATAKRKRIFARKIAILTAFVCSEAREVGYNVLDSELAEVEALESAK